MISRLLPVLAITLTAVAFAAADELTDEEKEMQEAAKIFDFSDLDVPGDPAAKPTPPEKPAPDDPLPANVRDILQKWDRFQQAKQEARRTQVKALREVTAEILLKRAASATTAVRPVLSDEAKRLTELDPDSPVAVEVAAPTAEGGLVDTWVSKSGKSWEFTADGRMLLDTKHTVLWSWVDEKNKVALAVWDGQYPNLIRVQGNHYDSIDLYSKPGQRTRVKATAAKPAAPNPATTVLTKLAADEKALSAAQEKLFAEKRSKIGAFIRAQVKEARGPAVAALMEKSALFDEPAAAPATTTVSPVKARGSERIAGTWTWPGKKKATLAEDGTATVEGLGTGVWRSGNKSSWAFAIVLSDKSGRVAAQSQLMLGRIADKDPALVYMVDMSGKRYEIQKAGPP